MEALTAIDFSFNTITHIDPGAFRNMTNLRTIILDTNRLYNVSAGTFEGCVGLETLSLQGNPIVSIMPGAWNGLAKLTDLALSLGANDPQQAAQGIFRDLDKLQCASP